MGTHFPFPSPSLQERPFLAGSITVTFLFSVLYCCRCCCCQVIEVGCIVEAALALIISLVGSRKCVCRDREVFILDTTVSIGTRYKMTRALPWYMLCNIKPRYGLVTESVIKVTLNYCHLNFRFQVHINIVLRNSWLFLLSQILCKTLPSRAIICFWTTWAWSLVNICAWKNNPLTSLTIILKLSFLPMES